MPPNPLGRDDAWAKASGAVRYVGDRTRPGMLHAAVVRSLVPRARILGVDTKVAESAPGVIGVFTAADVIRATYGRAVRDVPVLAQDAVRFAGEPIAAVVAETREAAEAAAAAGDVSYDELPAVGTAEGAPAADRT